MAKTTGSNMTIEFGNKEDGWHRLDNMSLVNISRDWVDVAPFDPSSLNDITNHSRVTVTMNFQSTEAAERLFGTWREYWLDPITVALRDWLPNRLWRRLGYVLLLVSLVALVVVLYG